MIPLETEMETISHELENKTKTAISGFGSTKLSHDHILLLPL